jgi:hypothetical protein
LGLPASHARTTSPGGHPQSWAEFSADNQDLLDWNDNILKKYYRDETLKSDLARSTFLLPDRLVA